MVELVDAQVLETCELSSCGFDPRQRHSVLVHLENIIAIGIWPSGKATGFEPVSVGSNPAVPIHCEVAKLEKAPAYESGDCGFESHPRNRV